MSPIPPPQRFPRLRLRSRSLVALLAVVVIATSGCASIVSHSSYPVTLDTDPSGLDIELADANGGIVYRGKSPARVTLEAADGYFLRAVYTLRTTGAAAGGHAMQIRPSIDGWFFGNIVFGGVIGMLIVDPITGAMYSLDDEYTLECGGTAAID